MDTVYTERAHLVAALSKLYPSSLEQHIDAPGETWDDDWRNVCFIDLPTGQVTFGQQRRFEVITTRKRGDRPAGSVLGSYVLSELDADLGELGWHFNGAGYLKRQHHLVEPTGYMHILVALRLFGHIPNGYEVDHIDRNTTNNSRGNIRLATSKAQLLNRDVTHGSIRKRNSGRWQAVFGTPQKTIGTFDTEKEARAALETYISGIWKQMHDTKQFLYPVSQVSWHIALKDMHLFAHLPRDEGRRWDGHDVAEKYRRLDALEAGA